MDAMKMQYVGCIVSDKPLKQLFSNAHSPSNKQMQGEHIQNDPPHFDVADIERNYFSDGLEGTQKKRNSRKTKRIVNKVHRRDKKKKDKLYIQMLQNRIFALQKDLQNEKRLNIINRDYIRKIEESGNVLKGLFANRQQHYDTLLNYIKEDAPEDRIKEELRMLRMRQGALSNHRIRCINYYFKELAEIILPDIQKYILKTVQEESDLFDPYFMLHGTIKPVEQWRKDMINDLGLTPDKIKCISILGKQIAEEKNNFSTHLQLLYEAKCSLMRSARAMEEIYDRLYCIFSPKQIAKCLCLLEKYKFEKGFSVEVIMKETFHKLSMEEFQKYQGSNMFSQVLK